MKPVILTFVSYYLPGYRAGGPIRTIANMVASLGNDFDFRIVALDRDLGDKHPYPGVQTDTWVPCGKAMVRYVSPEGFGLRKITDIARSTPHDVIYLNSFFDQRFTLQVLVNHRLGRLCGRPIVIASRGEFSSGALRIKSWKKFVFIRLAKLFALYDGLTWQASSAREAEDIQRAMSMTVDLAGRIVVSGHLVVAPDLAASGETLDLPGNTLLLHTLERPLRVCTLARISPMKNLDFALRVLAQVRVPVRFAIYGPVEDAVYWAQCEALIAKLPSNIEVVSEGPVTPEQVVPMLMQHDLFLFPTRGENFGHVIHEALRAGLPLLISDQTPWQGLEVQGVGWDLPLTDMGAFVQRIEEIADWSTETHAQWKARARAMAIQVGGSAEVVEANRCLFLDAISNATLAKDRAKGKGVGTV